MHPVSSCHPHITEDPIIVGQHIQTSEDSLCESILFFHHA
ncbi:hypothetical protein LEMLEM_LOCUS7086, partial [Lemmus lemmus]